MKVTVVWHETWVRRAQYDVDEVELTEWLGGEPVTDAKVLEFIQAGRDQPEPTDLLGGTVYPGSAPGDEFGEFEIVRVEGTP